jgi:hypothetical protein
MLPREPIVAIAKRNAQGQWCRKSEARLNPGDLVILFQARQGIIAVVGPVEEADKLVLRELLKDLLPMDSSFYDRSD